MLVVRWRVTFERFCILLVFSLAVATRAQNGLMTVTGTVTDTLAGARGASAGHADAARAAVKSGEAQYALWDENGKTLYVLEPQATAAHTLASA
jgi:hypothetical protein